MRQCIRQCLLVCMWLWMSFASCAVAEDHFASEIAPLLARRCATCHSGAQPKGGLNLTSAEFLQRGGDSGPVLAMDDPLKSPLWLAVDSDTMPPKKPLSDQEKATLRQWITTGAKWSGAAIDPMQFSSEGRAGRDWWAWQPLTSPAVPAHLIENKAEQAIDFFVRAKLAAAGLEPSPPADKRVLIRRLFFDLIGLPPAPHEIEEFLKDDSPDAYEHLVDRLLESPHYGERWGRHWLDVVRFGESNGFEYDEPRDNFWYYRNWVIDALNRDLPYDQFVRMQIAGDIMQPEDPNAAAAVGFLVAGPHNTTLPSNDVMRATMAQDELEELVGTVSQTFLGLTANCARCHDHKFDPIPQREYYQLAATLAGVQHGERKIKVGFTAEQQIRLRQIQERVDELRLTLTELERPTRELLVAERASGQLPLPQPPLAWATWEFDEDLRDSTGKWQATAYGSAKVEHGALVLDGKTAYVATDALPQQLTAKTLVAQVQLDNLQQRGGGVMSVQTTNGESFDAIVYGEREPKKWMSGSNNFARTKNFEGPMEAEADQRPVHLAIVYEADGTIRGYRNGKPYGETYRASETAHFKATSSQVLFGLRHSPVGGNRMLAGRIHRAQLYDRALTDAEVATVAGTTDLNSISDELLESRMPAEQAQQRRKHIAERQQLLQEQKAILDQETRSLYTNNVKQPRVMQVLRRGNVTEPQEEIAPAGLTAITNLTADFKLPSDALDSQRRLQLANWITHRENPLFARVIVNRLWHYHFGQGLVTTTNDFGFNGGQPSHPELLDWLAGRLRDGGFCLKPLHRLIVCTATYRQASDLRPEAQRVDADNRWLWRKSPLRLEAEALRDAGLVCAGQLNTEVGGKGYRDVRHYFFKGSHFYESVDEIGSEPRRRTVYRFAPRGGRNPFLDTFDCPDPSTAAPKRATTTTPLQALSLMNNAMVFQIAEDFARRLQREETDLGEQIKLAYLSAYARPVRDEELPLATDFVQQHGLASFCRVLTNSNEFLYLR